MCRVQPLLALLALLAFPTIAQAAPQPAVTHVDTPAEIHVDLAGQVRAGKLAGVRAMSPATAETFLPTTWCGSERTSDDTADSTLTAGQPYYKLVYAYASDQPDRFDAWKDVLQADVSLIGRYMGLQDGATRSPRFDMGTSCGPRYVDIQVVHLPGTRASYADNLAQIKLAVDLQIGAAGGPRNVVVLADGLTNDGPYSLHGVGEYYLGAAGLTGASNPHNGGGLYAVLYPPQGYDPAVAPGDEFYPGFWAEGMLHEITHTLGAVDAGAPHATSAGHCTDGYDVMCYADGAGSAAPYSTTACPQLSGSQAGLTQTYDCNRDDYFAPDPAPGSYLATHWNVFDNAFEAACATIGDACGSQGPSVPASIAAPSVLGVPQQGETLGADRGTWSGSPDGFAYQWQRTPIGGGTPADVAGATDASYTLGVSDVGRRLRLAVVASNPQGDSAPAYSAPGALVTSVAIPPSATTPTPKVTSQPVTPQAAYARTAVQLRRGRRNVLRVTVTRQAVGTGLVASVVSKRARLSRRGAYRLSLCVGPICIAKPFRARRGTARVPAIVAASTVRGAITLALLGPGGRATGAMP